MSNKFFCFITARLKSKRLKKKVIKKIVNKELILHQVDRLNKSKLFKKVIVITSPLKGDKQLVDLLKNNNVDYFEGSPNDVLKRILNASQHFGAKNIFSCTADNPFISLRHTKKQIDYFQKKNLDYLTISNLPFGTSGHCIKIKALKKACDIKLIKKSEIWGEYFTKSGIFNIGNIRINDYPKNFNNTRLTIDYVEDFNLATYIFENLKGFNDDFAFDLNEIYKLFKYKPSIFKKNKHCLQKTHTNVVFKVNEKNYNSNR